MGTDVAAEGNPVRIEVVEARVERGHAMLSLSRRPSDEWKRTFTGETAEQDFLKRIPDGWKHKRPNGSHGHALWVFDHGIQVRDAPADSASFKQLMLAVRDAVARTNAARPPDDPPTADASLNPVLDEVFPANSPG